MALSRDEILAKRPRRMEKVAVPDLGGEVYVAVMRGVERDQFEDLLMSHQEAHGNNRLPHLRGVLVCLTVCDAGGQRLFTLEDLAQVNELEADALDKVFEVARRLNGLTPQAAETITKNDDSAQSDDSGSPLP